MDTKTKTKTELISVFGSVFSDRDGNQKRNRTDFGFWLGFFRSRWKLKAKSNRFRFSARFVFFWSRWKPKPRSNRFRFSARFGFFRSRWKPKPKPNHFRFSLSVLVSHFFSVSVWFGFCLPYLLQFHPTKHDQNVWSNSIPIHSKSNSLINFNYIEFYYANQKLHQCQCLQLFSPSNYILNKPNPFLWCVFLEYKYFLNTFKYKINCFNTSFIPTSKY